MANTFGPGPLTERILSEIRAEFPGFIIIDKAESRLSQLIARLLWILTFGGQNSYLTVYHTVLGMRLYVAPSWHQMGDEERYVLLCHERVHLRQRRRYTFAGMAFLYLVPFLPLGLAYGRARLEWEAYRATLSAAAEVYGLEAVKNPAYRHQIVERFVSADYGWMWPFPRAVGRWYDREIAELEFGVRPDDTL